LPRLKLINAVSSYFGAVFHRQPVSKEAAVTLPAILTLLER
jgi:hypothetical protein